MASQSITPLLRHLRGIIDPARASGAGDGELLERFVRQRDEIAFELLVWRHQRMVLGVCRRVLLDAHEAEDAFQAAFLALVRRAEAVCRYPSVAGWLHKVAYHIALRARKRAAKRTIGELDDAAIECRRDPAEAAARREVAAVLDEEISRLPEKYRLPVVLCYLEGKTYQEAGRQLGVPVGTLSARLTRGRSLLHTRLARRGIGVSGSLLAVLLCEQASSAVASSELVKAATAIATGQSSGATSASIAALAESALGSMVVSKVKMVTIIVLAGCLIAGMGLLIPAAVAPPPTAPESPGPPAAAGADKEKPAHVDRYGDPLPPGVVARLGTERLAPGHITHLAFSPDGRRLAARDLENLWVWEVESGKEIIRLKLPTVRHWAIGLAFSPDGQAIAVGCGDHAIHVWETHTGKELHRLGDLQDSESNLAFSPDGRSLFTSGFHNPILCRDLIGGGKPRKIGDFDSALYLALSRDGKTLTAGRADGQDGKKWLFARWDLASGKKIGQQTLTTPVPGHGSLSPDGRIFARPEEDRESVTLLDPMTGREIARARDCNPRGALEFSAAGAVMTCCNRDSIVRIWDTATGKVRARFKALSTKIDCIALSPDGKRLALTGRADYAIHVWDVAAGRELHSFIGHRGGPLSVAFLKGGKEITTASRDGACSTPMSAWADWSLRRWDAATGAELAVTNPDLKGEVCHTSFSADGRRLATVSYDGTLRLWDVESGKTLRSWKMPTVESTMNWNDGRGGKKVIKVFRPKTNELAFTPDGKTLLATETSRIHRWEVATARELPTLEVEGIDSRNPSWCLPSPDGRTLLVWSMGGQPPPVLLVDAANGKVRHRLQVARGQPSRQAFSPDGRTLAIEEGGGNVTLWEVASGRRRGRFPLAEMIVGAAFSPDGRFLAVAEGRDSSLKLWDLVTGRLAARSQGDHGRMESLAFSPDGSRLAVAGYSPTVLIYDVAEMIGKKKFDEIAKEVKLSTEELEGLWAELSGADGARAYRVIRKLGLSGPRGVDFLKARLKGDKPPDERRIARLIADLDADQFATREKASVELAKLGVRAEPALRRTLKGEVSAEVRRRVQSLLERLGASQESPPSPELVRLRVVEALEANGSKEARQVLAELSEETTDARLAREAKASLERLSRRLRP
jgi:RNA polymerase sigma factor (sigma-70 family)